MQKLVEGIHQFQTDIFSSKQRLFERLVDGQHPLALFITCSDSRIDPSLLTQTEPGELFIMRNAGNIVPPYGTINGGEAATIEFAVGAQAVHQQVEVNLMTVKLRAVHTCELRLAANVHATSAAHARPIHHHRV